MRNNQNLPNRRIDSNNINGRQLPSTSPIYNNSRSRTPYRSQSRNNYNNNNNTNPRDNRNYQGYRRSNNYNNRSTSYNRNNYSRNRSNSYNRNYNYNKHNNSRSSSRYTDRNNSRQQSRTRRTNSITTEERETTVTEPPLPFYKKLTSMSINEEPQIEQNISSGSVPTTIRPFDGTDPAYTVEEYLNSIVATMIFSSGIESVNKHGNHQWKVKRAALILHTLQGPAQKWYSTLPSETKLDWEIFCKEFSDMFDSEKSKQQAKIVLQQLQKHTNESLRSLELRIETLVKTAYSLYTEDYRNSVMNQTFIRCLDNELKTAALKKHGNHKQTPREPEMPFKTLVDKIDQMDLTRTIINRHKRL